jgi:excisionase family DNA binding protein
MTGTIISTKKELCDAIKEMLPEALKAAARSNPEKLYTLKEIARLTGKKIDTIKRMTATGRIQATADGRYISQKGLDEYLTGKTP